MNFTTEWKDYKVIATGNGYKLEDFGGIVLLRPDPQIIWNAPFDMRAYKGLHAVYERSSTGGGEWIKLKPIPEEFNIHWRELKFSLKLMGFKHTGVFPEQAYNWGKMQELIKGANREIKVLNLFAYTGGATIACASAGAKVTHVDAAKAMGNPYHVGVVQCKDSFYGQHSPARMPTHAFLEDRWEAWKRLGVLASEMESATLFTVCAALGARAGALFNTVWNQERIKLGIDSPLVESHDTSTAIRTAVNAIKLLIERSK